MKPVQIITVLKTALHKGRTQDFITLVKMILPAYIGIRCDAGKALQGARSQTDQRAKIILYHQPTMRRSPDAGILGPLYAVSGTNSNHQNHRL